MQKCHQLTAELNLKSSVSAPWPNFQLFRAFSVAALRAWNRLTTEMKLLRSTDSFRRELKTFLQFCLVLITGTRIQIESVMCPGSCRLPYGTQYKSLSYSYSLTPRNKSWRRHRGARRSVTSDRGRLKNTYLITYLLTNVKWQYQKQ